MKKVIVFFVAAVLLLLLSASLPAEGFRNAEWGMTADEVRGTAQEELIAYEGDVFSVLGTDSVSIFDMKCLALYFFSHKGRLVKGGFFFEPGYDEPQSYVGDFFRLQSVLTSVYGEGDPEEFWLKGEQVAREDYGRVIDEGNLVLVTHWEQGDTYIELALGKDEYGISLMIQYFSRSLYDEYLEMLALHDSSNGEGRKSAEPDIGQADDGRSQNDGSLGSGGTD